MSGAMSKLDDDPRKPTREELERAKHLASTDGALELFIAVLSEQIAASAAEQAKGVSTPPA